MERQISFRTMDRAELHHCHAVVSFVVGSHDDHWRSARFRTAVEDAQSKHAIHARHVQVKDDDVKTFFAGDLDGVFTIGDACDIKADTFQVGGERTAKKSRIFYKQDFSWVSGLALMTSSGDRRIHQLYREPDGKL